jgi:hypothetical protein
MVLTSPSLRGGVGRRWSTLDRDGQTSAIFQKYMDPSEGRP